MYKKITAFGCALLAAALLLAIFGRHTASSEQLVFTAFDIGQGDSFLFVFPTGESMLVDTGPSKSSKLLASKLRSAGVSEIDLFVATHPHEDHIGGAVRVLRTFRVGRVWDSGYSHGSSYQRRMLAEIRDRGIKFGRPKAGHRAELGGASIEVLAPDRAQISGSASDANNSSIIMLVKYGDVSFLMTGDAQDEERALVRRWPRSDVLKVAHHGARNGTDERLLDEARPRVAVISCGRDNEYGHPHKRTMDLLKARGIDTAITAGGGDIVIRTDGREFTIEQ